MVTSPHSTYNNIRSVVMWEWCKAFVYNFNLTIYVYWIEDFWLCYSWYLFHVQIYLLSYRENTDKMEIQLYYKVFEYHKWIMYTHAFYVYKSRWYMYVENAHSEYLKIYQWQWYGFLYDQSFVLHKTIIYKGLFHMQLCVNPAGLFSSCSHS